MEIKKNIHQTCTMKTFLYLSISTCICNTDNTHNNQQYWSCINLLLDRYQNLQYRRALVAAWIQTLPLQHFTLSHLFQEDLNFAENAPLSFVVHWQQDCSSTCDHLRLAQKANQCRSRLWLIVCIHTNHWTLQTFPSN